MRHPEDGGLQTVKVITQEKQVGVYASVVQKKHTLKKFDVAVEKDVSDILKEDVVEQETRKSIGEVEVETVSGSASVQKKVMQEDAESDKLTEVISSGDVEEGDIEEGKIISNWAKVSLDNIGRSLVGKSQALLLEQGKVISPSRISVLQKVMEEETQTNKYAVDMDGENKDQNLHSEDKIHDDA
ncbi:hypothetical protein YC2023_066599 [Brassica napus]